MSTVAIRIPVTAAHIAAAGSPPPGPVGIDSWKDPVERALADVTGQAVLLDHDGLAREIATIGPGHTTLVELEDWLVETVLSHTPEVDLRVAARAARTIAQARKAATA